MIVVQVIIATPLVVGYTMAAVSAVNPDLRLQLQSIGATRLQITFYILHEAPRASLSPSSAVSAALFLKWDPS